MRHRSLPITVLVLLPVILGLVNVAAAAPTSNTATSDAVTSKALLEKAKQQVDQNHQTVQLLLALAEKQVDVTNAAYEVARSQINHPVPDALDLIYSKRDTEASATIRMIGQFRDASAIPFLLNHITFADNNYSLDHGYRPYLPCLDALLNIGSPAQEAMVEFMKTLSVQTQTQKVTSDLLATAIIHILGRPAAVASIQDAITKTTDATQQQALTDWLNIVRNKPDTKTN